MATSSLREEPSNRSKLWWASFAFAATLAFVVDRRPGEGWMPMNLLSTIAVVVGARPLRDRDSLRPARQPRHEAASARSSRRPGSPADDAVSPAQLAHQTGEGQRRHGAPCRSRMVGPSPSSRKATRAPSSRTNLSWRSKAARTAASAARSGSVPSGSQRTSLDAVASRTDGRTSAGACDAVRDLWGRTPRITRMGADFLPSDDPCDPPRPRHLLFEVDRARPVRLGIGYGREDRCSAARWGVRQRLRR